VSAADLVWITRYEGKKPDEVCKQRWEDNIKMILKDINWEGVK
jgi:hypothetical protein